VEGTLLRKLIRWEWRSQGADGKRKHDRGRTVNETPSRPDSLLTVRSGIDGHDSPREGRYLSKGPPFQRSPSSSRGVRLSRSKSGEQWRRGAGADCSEELNWISPLRMPPLILSGQQPQPQSQPLRAGRHFRSVYQLCRLHGSICRMAPSPYHVEPGRRPWIHELSPREL